MVVFVGTTISPEERKHYWQTKRMFFTTPHNMATDLNHGTCPGKDVVLIVVDEAHRATVQYPALQRKLELLDTLNTQSFAAFRQALSHKATGRGLNKCEQIAIIRPFQEGGYNVLVSTSMLQRMGRTGRKREGRVVCLLTAGKGEELYQKSHDNYKSVQNMIQRGGLQLFDKPARMIPFNIKPMLIKCFLKIPPLPGQGDDEDEVDRPVKRGRRGGAKRAGAFLTLSELVNFMAKFELPRDAPPVPELSLTRYLDQQVLRPGKFIAPSVTSEQFMNLLSGLHERQRTVIEEQLASATAFGAGGDDDDYELLTQVSDVATTIATCRCAS
ncbi:hypothetical protein AMAG_17828 [Allomyces macrogynus ATCC 38327]|uniref:ATP-dependent DNA helicase n=1 Tax=Allomyces macrogynus (strain ATCC 38327) TaxID=578462 RepID=A0A0L0S0E4_ALLM3|nr:hypothetical protein AMAG_17828 [Allomyces macrogynus ATCC 38327]|eukprot:KNE55794.1 hypothetical protein AMAG_17828 [Allomyces macrogynus ATCC 38327]